MPRKFHNEVRYRIAQGITSLVGCLFLAMGFCGIWGLPLQPVHEISFLMDPTTLGPAWDRVYYYAMMIVGGWLVAFYWVRPAAIAAIFMIVFKYALLSIFAVA